MKRAIRDDAKVQAIAERIGAWPAIQEAIAQGPSGSLIAGDWVIGFFMDGLCAFETSSPMEAVALAGTIARQLGGLTSARLVEPATAPTH